MKFFIINVKELQDNFLVNTFQSCEDPGSHPLGRSSIIEYCCTLKFTIFLAHGVKLLPLESNVGSSGLGPPKSMALLVSSVTIVTLYGGVQSKRNRYIPMYVFHLSITKQ